ncbi:gonadotropin-releasing hormone II receptor [Labeo rohita]|uniref:Gonadotropin-releasing hormone II receptor n=1 Tax=Labeo rohita TaxID=84645 RepID=A0A498P0D8_LABRO|nr:gonadotropin-releasing hormone II receptor [Labeo rohita]
MCALSACCNLAVLYAANHNHRKRSHVRLIISNLAVADLLVTFIVMPLDAVWNITVQWLAGDVACRTLMFLKLMAMYSCAFVTVVISLDRQAAILNPLSINKARKRNKVLLSAAWTMSVVLSVPQIILEIRKEEDYRVPIWIIIGSTLGGLLLLSLLILALWKLGFFQRQKRREETENEANGKMMEER